MGEDEPGSRPADDGTDHDGEPEETHEVTGLDLARSIARGLAGKTPQRSTQSTGRRNKWQRGTTSSGAHADDRDPQSLDATLGRFVGEQGWETELRVHGVFSRWEAIVGHEVAQHVTPESFADGRLVVRTDSTAWAVEVKHLAPTVIRRLNEVLGDETVRVIDASGPRAPSWKKGRLRVKGRGPRDTYG